MIKAVGVTVRAGKRLLLDDVSLHLAFGSFTALLGPNGAGKTTLLRVMAGALIPNAGTVTLDATPLSCFGATALARRRAVLSQNSSPVLGLRVRDAVALGRLVFRQTADQRHDREAIAEARANFDLDSLWNRSMDSLSGGERQRVQIARAATQLWRPDARAAGLGLFLDEPAASLDLAQQGQALRFARDSAARGAAVLAVLHDPNQALYADQVGLLRDGRMLAIGQPAKILTPDNLLACLDVQLHIVCRSDGQVALVA